MKLIRKALEDRLKLIVPAMPIAFENAKYTPVIGTAYQKAMLLPNDTDTPTLSQTRLIETGIFQVSVYVPFGGGTGLASDRAVLIRNHFPAGLVLTEATTKIRISKAPSIAGAIYDDVWYLVPVSIPFICIK